MGGFTHQVQCYQQIVLLVLIRVLAELLKKMFHMLLGLCQVSLEAKALTEILMILAVWHGALPCWQCPSPAGNTVAMGALGLGHCSDT